MSTVRTVATPVDDEDDYYENGFGTAGLVLGIIAMVVAIIPLVGILAIPLALVGLGLSIPGLLRANSGRASNFGSAVAGLVLSTLALIGGFVWIAVVAAAAGTDSTPKPAAAAAAGTTAKKAAPKAAAPAAPAAKDVTADGSAVALGKAVVIDDFGGHGRASLTVDKFTATAKSNNEFIRPSAGNKFVAAHIKVKNVGDSTYSNVSWVGAKVYTKEGQAYDLNPMVESGVGRPLPSSIDLKPGGSVDGWMLFEIPVDGIADTVVFDDAEWQL